MGKKDIRDCIIPWLISALISSAVTFALLILFILFPGVKEYLTIGDDSFLYLPFIGACAPFEGTPLTFVALASLFYVVIGVAGSRQPLLMGFGWRSILSNIFLNLAIAIFLFIIPLLSVIWALAIKDWNIAIGVWSNWESNHGPWYRLYHLRRLLSHAFFLPNGSLYFALISLVFKPNILATMVIFGSGILWLVLLFTHSWLID